MSRYFEKIILLVIFFSAFPFSPYLTFAFTDLKKLLIVFSLVILLYVIRINKTKVSYLSILLTIFSFFGIFSILWTESIYTYGDELFVYLFPLFGVIVLNSTFKRGIFEKIIYFLTTIGLFYSIYGILQYFGIDFYFFKENTGRYRMIGLMGNPIYFSEYILPLFIFSFSIFLFSKKKIEKIVYSLIALSLGWVLLATLSRGSWIGAFFGISLLSSLWIRKKNIGFWKIYIPINLFLLGVVLSFQKYRVRFLSIFNFHESSIYRRFMIWLISLSMWKDHILLGVGCGGYKYLFLKYQAVFFSGWGKNLGFPAGKALKAHNDIVEMFAELGLVGGILFLVIIWIFVYEGWKTIKVEDRYLKYRIGFYIGSLSMLVDGLTGFPLRIVPSAILFWLFLGLSFVNVKNIRRINIEIGIQKLFKYLGFFLFLLYFLFLLQNHFALVYERMGEIQFLKKKDIKNAEYFFEKEVKIMPIRGVPHFYLGTIDFLEGKVSDGIKEMEIAQKSFDYQEIHASLGYYYLVLGRYKDAIEEYKKAIMYKKQKDPHYKVKYLADIGLCYKELGEYRKAERYYIEALKIDPKFINALYNLGVLYDILGKKDKAYGVFRRIFDIVKEDGKVSPDELSVLEKIAKLGYISLKVE